MSSAEWNVLGLILVASGILMLFRYGLPGGTRTGGTTSWLALALFIAGIACQIWASVRWVT